MWRLTIHFCFFAHFRRERRRETAQILDGELKQWLKVLPSLPIYFFLASGFVTSYISYNTFNKSSENLVDSKYIHSLSDSFIYAFLQSHTHSICDNEAAIWIQWVFAIFIRTLWTGIYQGFIQDRHIIRTVPCQYYSVYINYVHNHFRAAFIQLPFMISSTRRKFPTVVSVCLHWHAQRFGSDSFLSPFRYLLSNVNWRRIQRWDLRSQPSFVTHIRSQSKQNLSLKPPSQLSGVLLIALSNRSGHHRDHRFPSSIQYSHCR